MQTKNVAKALTTYVVSASISDTSLQNLADLVVIYYPVACGRNLGNISIFISE